MPKVDFEAAGALTGPERVLLEVLSDLDGSSSFEDLLAGVQERDPTLTSEDVRGAIWALASRKVLEVTWDGELTPA